MTAYAPVETAKEIASSNSATHKQLNKLTKTLFGKYGHTKFEGLPIRLQHIVESVQGAQWGMEDGAANV